MGVGRFSKLTTSFAILLTLLFSLMGGTAVHAQVTGATLSGTVTDPSGATITGATISVKQNATGVSRDTTSDAAGLYTVPNLAPGDYEVRVSATGFSTTVQSNLSLAVGQQQQLNFSMKVGQANTTVQVTEAAPQIDLTSSALSGQVESETVRELPLNGRDWTSLAVLQPGVKPIETQMSYSTSARGNRGFGSEMTISGQRSTFNNYRIDGIGVTDYANAAPGNVIGVVLGVDAIEEFSVLTGGFPAEYGRATGGVVNAISRSGTNQFHGGVYEFLRNSALDANDYFIKNTPDPTNPSKASPTPPFRRNQFGAAVGGPIIKDKTFFFADYEGLKQSKGIPTNVGDFTTAQRNGEVGGPIISTGAGTPCTTTRGGAGTYPTANSTICVSSYAQKLLQLWPAANVGSRFVFAGIQNVPENFGTVRLDHKIGSNDSLFGTYLIDDADYVQPDTLNDVNSNSHTTRTTIALEETHTFSSSFVNAARIGYNRDHVVNQFTPSFINALAGSTALGSMVGQSAARLTVHGGIGDFFGGVNAGSHYLHSWNSYQYYDDAFWTKGAHTFKIGGGVERMDYNEHTFQEPGGRWQFADPTHFLEGDPKSFEASLVNAVDNPREFRQTMFSLYAQDDWKFKPNLTINMGIRYEPSTVLKDAQGRITNLADITAVTPTCGTSFTAPAPISGPGSSCGSVGPYYKNPTLRNFEPRLGFAWDPFKDGKSSVRGSFGIYDVDPLPGYFLLQQNQAGPFLVFKSIKGGNLSAQSDPFEAGSGTSLLNLPNVSKLAESTIEGAPHRSYVMQWNLSLQRQVTSDISLTVGYVGSHGVHLMMRGDDGNMTLPTQTPYGYEFGGPQVNPSLGIIRYIYWNTDSHYNGLNIGLDKKFAHGFQFQVAYTFSKSLDDDSQTIAGDTFANGINSPWWMLPKLSYGPSDFNVAHTLSINGLYTVPTPKSWRGFAAQALGNWQLGGIFTYNSGTPTTPINNGDPLGLGNSGADQFGPLVKLPGCNPVKFVPGGSSPGYINQSCYTEPYLPTSALASLPYPCVGFPGAGLPGFIPAAPTGMSYCSNLAPGNYGRNSITGPHFINMDFSVHKDFPIRRISEQFNVEFRAEFFNITNHDNFVPPQPCSGDCNSGLIGSNPNAGPTQGFDGFYQGVGNIAETASLPREIQFALKVNW
jgi:hypothetical protein